MKVTIGIRLKELMKANQLTQKDIIKKTEPFINRYHTKITKANLSQYVNDHRQPTEAKLFLLAKAMDVSPAWLLGFDVPKARQSTDLLSVMDRLTIQNQKKVFTYTKRVFDEQSNTQTSENLFLHG